MLPPYRGRAATAISPVCTNVDEIRVLASSEVCGRLPRCVGVCLFRRLPRCVGVCLFRRLPRCLGVCLFWRLPRCVGICLFRYIPRCVGVCLFRCLPRGVRASVCLVFLMTKYCRGRIFQNHLLVAASAAVLSMILHVLKCKNRNK